MNRPGFIRVIALRGWRIFYFFALVSILNLPVAHAGTSTLIPTADAYVQNGENASENYGNSSELRVRTSSTTSNYDTYLKFDASPLGNGINSAKLRIYAKLSASGTVTTTAYGVSSTSWSETGITWKNKPARGASLGSATINTTSYGWLEVDVTAYVKSEIAAGRKLLSFAYRNGSSSSPYISANSRNATSNRPELVIVTGVSNALPTISLTSPSSGASFTAPANISLSANAADSDGTVVTIAFYNGTTLLGTSTTSAPYTYNWNNIAAGSYTLTAKATDNAGGVTTSSPITVTVTSPIGSSLTVTPTADAYVVGGSNRNYGTATDLRIRTNSTTSSIYDAYLKFDATAATGSVATAKLRVYAKLSGSGTVSTTAYAVSNSSWGETTINWSNKPARGASLASVTINSTSYAWKEIDVTSYVQSEFAAGRKVLSFAYHNSANSSPYITANSKEATNKPQLVLTFTPNTPPSVSLTSPVNGATYNALATIDLAATAADVGGTITKVEFYNGATLIGTDTTSPYTFAWANVTAGTYTLTAKATDNATTATVSSPVTVTVASDSQGPAISALTPANQAVLSAATIPTISATYSDSGAGINIASAKLTVDGQDVTAQAQVTSSGISFTPAQALTEGDHTIAVAVADNSGNLSNASWMFTTRSAPQITGFAPANLQEIAEPRTPITASYNDVGAGIDATRTVLTIDGFVTAAQGNATTLTFTPTSDWLTGTHSVSLTVFDLAGNSSNAAWSFNYDPPPQIYDETPRDVYVAVPNPLVRVLLRDMGNGINLAATTLKLNGVDVSAQASITAAEIRYTPVALSAGVHTFTVQTQSSTGKIATKQWQFTVMLPPAPAVTEDGVRTAPVLNIPMQTHP